MTWLVVLVLALVVLAVLVFAFRLGRGPREAVGAALLLGIAGYAAQGTPGQPGSPREAGQAESPEMGTFFVEAREKLSASGIPTNDRDVVIADGFARHGQFADAAALLRGAIDQTGAGADDPVRNPDARARRSEVWLSLANMLVGHAEGTLTPPAQYAYRRAAKADPEAAGPPFFLGLALAQSGRLDEGRKLWADLLARAPADAAWRPALAGQLTQLDAFIAAQRGGPANPQEPAGDPSPQ